MGDGDGEKSYKARVCALTESGTVPAAWERRYLIVPRARSEDIRGLQAPRRYRSPAGFADFLRHKLGINILHGKNNRDRYSKNYSARL